MGVFGFGILDDDNDRKPFIDRPAQPLKSEIFALGNAQSASAQSPDEFCGAATVFRKWIHPAVKCVETGPWLEGFQHHQTGDRAAGVGVDLAVVSSIDRRSTVQTTGATCRIRSVRPACPQADQHCILPLPDSLTVSVNLTDSVERNPPKLAGFIQNFKSTAFTRRKYNLVKWDTVNRALQTIQIADLKPASAKFLVVTDAAQQLVNRRHASLVAKL